MLGPVDQVGTAEGIKMQLLFVRGAVGGENPILAVENRSLGICIPALRNGIAAGLLLFGISNV